MTTYVMTDPHLTHTNCAVEHRKFNTVAEHDELIQDNVLSVMTKRDKLIVLGDVGHNKKKDSLKFWAKVPGFKELVMGNHDQCIPTEYVKYFNKIAGLIKHRNMWFSHAPIHPCEIRKARANVHGHKHADIIMSSKHDGYADDKYFNANVDVLGYAPINLDTIEEMVMDGYRFKPDFMDREPKIYTGWNQENDSNLIPTDKHAIIQPKKYQVGNSNIIL